MKARIVKPFLWLAAFILLVGLACKAGESTPTPEPVQPKPATEASEPQPVQPTTAPIVAATEVPTEAPTEEPASGAVGTLDELESAVVGIEVAGSYVDPYEGWQVNSARGGTGFILDPSGIAVTNNHVVTGAAQVKVWISGEDSPRNAKILGVSECSDLAVIDIDGDGFPYLDWYSGSFRAGEDVYSAGFPGSAAGTDYTLTKGIVSKAKAALDSNWASVDNVIEHTAKINPGNSGGPLVNTSAQVLGVNYAGVSSADQNYAISRDIARNIVAELREGKNVDSIGVNGVAVSGELEGNVVTGIWVRSVRSGSPADKARIQAGDIIIEMESQVMEDADMQDYCSVLRAHNATDTLSVTVIRSSTLEILEGQLNGRELAYVDTLSSSSEPTTSGGKFNENASAKGDIYYQEEFDGDLTDWTYFLTNGEDDDFEAETTNSRLHFDISGDNTWIYFTYDAYEIADVRIDTTVENLGFNDNNISLICRYSDRGWYEFNIASNGEWTILRFDPLINDYRAIYTGGSRAIRMGQDTNTYTAICKGDKLTLGINGVEVRTVTDKNLKTGTTGISVSSFRTTPIIVEFDNFILSVP